MPPRRAIGERLRRAKSPEARRHLVLSWAENWQRDLADILDTLNAGITGDDRELLTSAAGQLRSSTEKGFAGLERILETLLENGQPADNANCKSGGPSTQQGSA